MTEAELLELARDREPAAGGLWSSHLYGNGKWLRRYAGYPDDLPLCADIDHGPGISSIPHDIFLQTKAPVMLYHNAGMAESHRHFSATPCEVMGSPFVYFRWLNGIGIRPDAAGTVAFPTHSTHHVRPLMDWGKYCEDLRRIPERFRPVTVCLYWKDILDGLHKVFMQEGFEVVTAGHIYDEGFVERLYGILARHRYATSNESCTAGFYAVEMGLPFFLWGEQEFNYYNTGGEPCLPKGGFDSDAVVGYYTLDAGAIGRLRAEGMPEGVAAGLEGLAGKRIRKAGEFLDLVARYVGGGLTGVHREAILRTAAVPQHPRRDRAPFVEPSTTVPAAQTAHVEKALGIHAALRPSQLRELLWACLDEAVLGTAGAVRRVLPALRRHPHDPSSGVRACPACGSYESKALALADIPDSPVPATFRLCLDCGTCSRPSALPRPARPAGPPSRRQEGGVLRIDGLETCFSPLDELQALTRGETGTIRILARSLGGDGPETALRDEGIRTLFTVTGMRRLMRRAGFSTLSVCQDSRGGLEALGRASGRDFPPVHAAPEPVDTGVDAVLRPRSSEELGGEAQAAPAGKPDDPERLAALLSVLLRRPRAPDVLKSLAELYFRVGNHAASEAWLGLYTERGRPDPSVYALMDTLRARLGFEPWPRDASAPAAPGPGWSAAPAEGVGDGMHLIVSVIEALSQDRDSEALDLVLSGLRAGRRDPELRYARAIALERLGRRLEAIEALEDLLAERPDHGEARGLLRRLAPAPGER